MIQRPGSKASRSCYHFHIGNGVPGDWDFPFNGVIDGARVYNRALTAAEVKQLYQLGQVIIRQ
ncbi:MAG: LamG domain-containing protein [Rhodospirillales bacterium]|nr:LamG domain-containing protein [Rhodospirillales bacterium]